MITRIRKFSILQTGKLLAVLYGFLSVLFLPFLLLAFVMNPKEAIVLIFIIILYPLMGFIGGIIGAAIYNLAASLVGGLEITLDINQPQSDQRPNSPNSY